MKIEIIYCACGCGNKLNKYDYLGRVRKFIHGHNSKMEDFRKKASIRTKNRSPPNVGKQASLSTRKKQSESLKKYFKNHDAWNKGIPMTEKQKTNISIIKKHNYKIGKYKKYWLGKKRSKKTVGKIRKTFEKRGISIGKNNSMWLGGLSREPYGVGFNNTLKRKIKQRDNSICQQCMKHQKELDYPLHVHHIDYNKKNNKQNNLITLCVVCHAQTNFKREDWTNYFQEKVNVNEK